MKLIKNLRKQAKQINSIVLLPEANIDKRVYSACEFLLKNKLSKIAVFGKPNEFGKIFQDKTWCQIIDTTTINKTKYAKKLFKLREHKGMTLEQATSLLDNPQYLSMMLLKDKKVNAVVAGAVWSSAETLKPALQIIKTKKGKNKCFASMLMLKKGKRPLVFSDIALIQQPSAEDLSEIAISSAEFMDKVLGLNPKVAMLSFSTYGSAKGEMVDLVKNATILAQKKSNYDIQGEIQVDVALDVKTAKFKGATSTNAGKSNVLVFPDLNSGNIGYKLVSKLAGYQAVGPIILNFNQPVEDLSRGCTKEEVINTVCIAKLLHKN
ncbi:MAG: phosphotransacetylase [Clostridia bacterium]|nr:phosphotransacetylase [Clostridia bacterium]